MSQKFRLLYQIGYINLIVYIIVFGSGNTLTANGQLSNLVEKSRKIISPADEDATLVSGKFILNTEDEDEDVDDPKKFSWKNHQDDHSIYAHRSLMSSVDIKRPILSPGMGEEEVVEEDEGEIDGSPMRNKLKPSELDAEELAPLKTVDFAEKEWQLMFRSFDMMFDGISSSLIQELGQRTSLLKEVISRLKPECRRDIDHLRRGMKQHKLWALKMVDSIGKIPSGITYGKFSSPGDYEECLSVRVDEQVHTPLVGAAISNLHNRDQQQQSGDQNQKKWAAQRQFAVEHHKFHGKYCLIDFRLPLPERPKDKLLSIHDPIIDLAKTDVGKQYPDLQNYSGYASVFYEVGYMHAVCLPSTCDVTDLTRSLGKALEGLHIIVNNTVDCEERFDETPAWRTSQVIAASLLVVLFINATCATVMRYISKRQIANKKKDLLDGCDDGDNNANSNRHHKKYGSGSGVNGGDGWLGWATELSTKNKLYSECFSVQSNFERLSKPDPRGLTFVHYTRIVAMALTVITHTAGLGTLQAITKPADASNSEQIFRDFIPQMLANAFTSIQIFFFMAGFMLVISTYPSINREKGHVSFLEYAIKRAIRLMPGLAATICLNFLWPLLVDGPMLSYFVRLIVEPCESNWWRTMAFLSNFDHVEKMCLRHSYFSASDYQLHILAFPLLILLYKQPNVSLIIAGILTCAGFVAQVIMILTKTVLPFMMVDYIDKQAFFNVVHYIHHPSWNHMSAFFYGFIIGYLVVKQIRIDLSEKTIKRLWYTILPIGIASIFAPYFWNHYKRPIHRWQMVLYVLIDRFALLTACAWLSYATMVLGREPPAPAANSTNQDTDKKQNTNGLNLPNIVALASAQPEKSSASASGGDAGELSAQNLENTWTNTLSLSPDKMNKTSTSSLNNTTTNLMRQRSSPNFQDYKQQQQNQSAPSTPTLRPAISSSNVHSEAAAQDHVSTGKQLAMSAEPERSVQAASTTTTAQLKTQAPISNVNTLCLILSRLTFQLYLFNMVVLWIDVNHSKYNWFFSYYFIITKALAIYICSSLMALVFFVTLESPSLTLYIMWVRSRAQARADRGTAAESAKKGKPEGGNNLGDKPSRNAVSPTRGYGAQSTEFYVIASPKSRTDDCQSAKDHNSGSDHLSGSSDGLNMRMGSPINSPAAIAKPTFSYIDLSSPSDTQTENVAAGTTATGGVSSFTGTSTTISTLQTKM